MAVSNTPLPLSVIDSKYQHLLDILKQTEKIAIAFSGGVDSTLLLYAGIEALGIDNVIAYFAVSPLLSEESVAGTRAVHARNYPSGATLREIKIFPLSWPEFVINDKDRCYYCKKRIYSHILQAISGFHHLKLADGTNRDDQHDDRPGARAIAELQILTPLADVGLTKVEIRSLAKRFGLSNYNQPSNSCLATRIISHEPIDELKLCIIDAAEKILHERGFWGCRVKPQGAYTVLELQEKDLQIFMESTNRVIVQNQFRKLKLPPVVLSIHGR